MRDFVMRYFLVVVFVVAGVGVAHAQDAPAPAATSLPAPWAHAGLRAGVGVGLLANSGDWGKASDGGVTFAGRFGYEHMIGAIGLSGGVRAGYSRFSKATFSTIDDGSIETTISSFEVGLDLRGAFHVGRFAPYLGASLGYEKFMDDSELTNGFTGEAIDPEGGVAFMISAGVDVMITANLALGVFFDVHAVVPKLYDFGEGAPEMAKAKRVAVGASASFFF